MNSPPPIQAKLVDPRVLQAVVNKGMDGVAVAQRAKRHARTAVLFYAVGAAMVGAALADQIGLPIPHLDHLIIALMFGFGLWAAFRAYLTSEMETGLHALMTFVASPTLWAPEFL